MDGRMREFLDGEMEGLVRQDNITLADSLSPYLYVTHNEYIKMNVANVRKRTL
jgi:hypothetical protein